MGSYSGPYVRVLDARARRLEWAQAVDAATGEVEEIHLPTTLKTAWKAMRREAGGIDLLVAACRPRLDGDQAETSPEFQISYTRYSLEAGGWRRYRRTVSGFWENEGQFPARSLFP